MKKLLFVGAFLFLGSLTLTSCKKDWTCECTVFGQTGSDVIKDKTKKDAKAECQKNEDDGSAFGIPVNCKLK